MDRIFSFPVTHICMNRCPINIVCVNLKKKKYGDLSHKLALNIKESNTLEYIFEAVLSCTE